MGKPISNITIVGGGTAGWIVAAYLNHRLQWGLTAGTGVKITVVESPGVPRVGVGEATTPALKGTLRTLEIPESQFVKRTDASFKLGIRFDRWHLDDGNGFPHSYVHPFTGGASVYGHNPGYAFQKYGLPGSTNTQGADFVRSISHSREAIEQGKGPRTLDAPPFEGSIQYAYHLDASLLAQFLKEVCLERGVEYVADEVAGVDLDQRGHIGALQLKERGHWPVELVVDCTGFKGLLINQALGEPFVSYSEYLLNDRAIPIQVLRRNSQELTPATIATALDAGWVWRTPLYTRDGTGYVYSSAHRSDDQALQELRRFLGGATEITSPGVIKMRVGRCRRSWVGNCVAIGLSSGFLEPLESTGILGIESAARWLLQYFPSTDFEEPLARQFNSAVQRFYDEVRDFLALHFTLSSRNGTPYWDAVRHETKRSEGLRENLALWKLAFPSVTDPRPDAIFGHWSVQTVLFGKGFYEGVELGGADLVPEHAWRVYWAECRAAKKAVLGRLPKHADLVEKVRANALEEIKDRSSPKGLEYSLRGDLLFAAMRVMTQMPASRLQLPRKLEK